MYVDNYFAAIEDAVGLLLHAADLNNPSPFRHSFPEKVSRDETIPILTEIDDNLQRLQRVVESLTQIKTRLNKWKGRSNHARPVGTLPVEILSDIFRYSCDEAGNFGRSGVALQLSHVSSSWRAISLAQSALWTDIDAEWEQELQDAWLERSKQQPLRISSEANTVHLSPRVIKAASRIDTIESLAVPGTWGGDLFPTATKLGQLPALRCINLNMRGWGLHPVDQWILHSPNLQHVTLHGVTFQSLDDIDLPSLPWTHLDISGYGNRERWLFKLFRACPRLGTLAIHNAEVSAVGIMGLEQLQCDGVSPPTPALFPYLRELYVETRKESDYIVRLLSRFTLASALLVLRIGMGVKYTSGTKTPQWHASPDILCLLDHSPLLETLEIFGHSVYTRIILRALAHYERNLPNLRELGVSCERGVEETWPAILELVAGWAGSMDTATDVIEELDIFNAPIQWRRERTMPHVGLLRFTRRTAFPIDLFRSANAYNRGINPQILF